MSTKKTWDKPAIELLDTGEIIERAKTREGLERVRDLVEQAVKLMEAKGEYSAGVVKAREVLALIDVELAKAADEGPRQRD